MSFLVNDVIREAREIYPDLADTHALRHFNRVRSTVLSELDLRKTSTTVNVAEGVNEASLAATALKIDSVEYVRSSTARDFKVLLPTSIDELNNKETEWRRLENNEPDRFYLHTGTSGPVIGVVPAPNETTSGGYPILRIYFSQNETLTAGGTLYDDLPSAQVYVYGIAREHAARHDKGSLANWVQLFEMEMAAAQRFLYNKQAGDQGVRFVPGWKKRTGVI